MTEAAATLRQAFLSRKCLVMAALGFACGLPYTIVTDTATALLAERKVDRETIGLLGAVGSVYAFKFLWAPVVDLPQVPLLRGRRRPWLFALQVPMIAIIALLDLVAPSSASAAAMPFAWALVGLTVLSATQDMVVNGWTVDAFPGRELGVGSSMYVLGYRVALVAAGALALVVARHWGWPAAFAALAAVMALMPIAAGMSREPHRELGAQGESVLRSIIDPADELIRRLGPAAIVVVCFVLLFRLPDQLGTPMQKPFLLDSLGYDLAQFGIARNGVGLAATLIGSLLGGALAIRLGLVPTLLLAGVAQALSNLGFVWLAYAIEPLGKEVQAWTSAPMVALFAVSAIESACGGLVGAAFVAWLMSLCAPRYGASQYALLTASFSLAAALASALSGFVARLEWPTFFLLTALAGLPGLALLPFATHAARPPRPNAPSD